MGRPRKNSKVNITEQDNTVKFVSGTQKQYDSKNKSEASKNKVDITEDEVRYVMGKPTVTTTPRITHIVQRGESIQSIAGRYSVPVMKLIKLNGPTVSVGQKIYID